MRHPTLPHTRNRQPTNPASARAALTLPQALLLGGSCDSDAAHALGAAWEGRGGEGC